MTRYNNVAIALHWLLAVLLIAQIYVGYVILIGLPLTGWLIISAGRDGGGTTLLGGLPWPFLPGIPEGAREAAGAAHGVLVKTTYALIILHVGAALKHQFIDKRHNRRMPPL